MSFQTKWNPEHYSPKEIEFPDGTTKIIQYMRDGLILFTDNSSAEYERGIRGEATISPIENELQVFLALASYKERTGQA